MIRRRRVIVAGVVLLALAGVVPVAAHSEPIAMFPEAGSTIRGTPDHISITFGEPLQAGSAFMLTRGQFESVPGIRGEFNPDAPTELRAEVGTPLPPDTYAVQWSAVGSDGDLTSGSYSFSVVPWHGLDLRVLPRLFIWLVLLAMILGTQWFRRKRKGQDIPNA